MKQASRDADVQSACGNCRQRLYQALPQYMHSTAALLAHTSSVTWLQLQKQKLHMYFFVETKYQGWYCPFHDFTLRQLFAT